MEKRSHKIMMHRGTTNKRLISELNSCITCNLCKGYFIDATTIIECLHTFCRSCIVKYLETNKYCPICDVQVHKTKPLLNIRQDKTIQDLVYKLVPRLYHSEAKRRKSFYESHRESKPSVSEENMASHYEYILSPEENINLTLNYDGCSTTPRYLRCSSAVSVAHLKKLIRAKYDLTERHKVDMLFNQKVLEPSWSLMDVAYIYSYQKTQSLDLTYKIYECRIKKPKLESPDDTNTPASSNNNNWKEVQLRISETGEMSITGIQDGGSMMDLLDATENFKNEVVINEGKNLDGSDKDAKATSESEEVKPTINGQKEFPDSSSSSKPSERRDEAPKVADPVAVNNNNKLTVSDSNGSISVFPVSHAVSSTLVASAPAASVVGTMPKSVELSQKLNLNSELSVIPLSATSNCVSLSSCGGTTTVFSTINKSMCSTKLDESCSRRSESKTCIDLIKEMPVSGLLKPPSNTLKRKCDEPEKSTELPAKLPKPTILNHSIGLLNLSNNHPLKKHSKLNRNGERRHLDISEKPPSLTVSPAAQKPSSLDNNSSKPIIINRNLNYLQQLQRCGPPKSKQLQKNNNSVPCYSPKAANGDRDEVSVTLTEKATKPQNSYQNTHHTPIITPAQLPHHQHLNCGGQTRQNCSDKSERERVSGGKEAAQDGKPKLAPTSGESTVASAASTVPAKPKPTAPMGYKTLRDPPKSWNSQINSQIAKVNQNAKAQQLANLAAAVAAGSAAQGRLGGDLKSVRPPKFFKGRNMPRYLGNPASGVKPMYQVHVSPDKDKAQEQQLQHPQQLLPQKTTKLEKSEIKKHSIVKIDPKTLKPISEKAPETSNLSNITSSLASAVSQAGQELRISSAPGDLKINTSSVSIFNPLKLQQNSPKNERRSPKSPHSPKVSRSNQSGSSTASPTSCATSTTLTSPSTLSPKQQRDKISLTTPPNPYIPNLASPTLNPNQFLYPAGGFPSYDPRFMAACHSLWYTQRMAAAAAAGLVPPALPHAFGLNMGLGPPNAAAQPSSSPGVSPKHGGATKANNSHPRANNSGGTSKSAGKKAKEAAANKSLEIALEKLSKQAKGAKGSGEKVQGKAEPIAAKEKREMEKSERDKGEVKAAAEGGAASSGASDIPAVGLPAAEAESKPPVSSTRTPDPVEPPPPENNTQQSPPADTGPTQEPEKSPAEPPQANETPPKSESPAAQATNGESSKGQAEASVSESPPDEDSDKTPASATGDSVNKDSPPAAVVVETKKETNNAQRAGSDSGRPQPEGEQKKDDAKPPDTGTDSSDVTV